MFSFWICQMEATSATYFSVLTLRIKTSLKDLRTFYRLILYDIKNNMAAIRSFSKYLLVWWLQLRNRILSCGEMYLYLRILYENFYRSTITKVTTLPSLSVCLRTCLPTYLPTLLPLCISVCLPVFFFFWLLCVFLKATDVHLALRATLIH